MTSKLLALLAALTMTCTVGKEGLCQSEQCNQETPEILKLRSQASYYKQNCFLNPDTNRFRVGPGNFVENKQFGIVYFEVPKSGSTAIAANLRAAHKATRPLSKGWWRRISARPSLPRKGFDDDDILFSCVRDPVSRFVSAVNFLTVMDRSLQHYRNRDNGYNGSTIAAAIADRITNQGYFNWHLWPQSVYLSK